MFSHLVFCFFDKSVGGGGSQKSARLLSRLTSGPPVFLLNIYTFTKTVQTSSSISTKLLFLHSLRNLKIRPFQFSYLCFYLHPISIFLRTKICSTLLSPSIQPIIVTKCFPVRCALFAVLDRYFSDWGSGF